MADYRITIAGDSALNIEFADTISPITSATIRLAAQTLQAEPIFGVSELVPTFCSLMVCYDPVKITFGQLRQELAGKLNGIEAVDTREHKIIVIPVCYGDQYGPDIDNVAEHAHLSCEEVIAIHSSSDYLIDMLGFLPGFAYLGGLDPRIHTPRLATPRACIDAGSVGIGGAQTGVYPLPSPGGWQIIGRTPVKPYDPEREIPILYSAGEYLRFQPITPEEYHSIEQKVAVRQYECDTFIEEG